MMIIIINGLLIYMLTPCDPTGYKLKVCQCLFGLTPDMNATPPGDSTSVSPLRPPGPPQCRDFSALFFFCTFGKLKFAKSLWHI